DLKSGESHEIAFDEPTYEVSVDQNPEFKTSVVRLNYSSFITPPSVIDYDMVSRQKDLRKEMPVLGGYSKTDYASERIFARDDDGDIDFLQERISQRRHCSTVALRLWSLRRLNGCEFQFDPTEPCRSRLCFCDSARSRWR